MIYKKYGEVFKKLRIQEEKPLSFFSSVGLSKSTLSDFERGNKMMAFDKVVIALQEMGFSLRSFENLLNNYIDTSSIDISYRMEEAVLSQDTEKLRYLHTLTKETGMEHLNLCINILLNRNYSDEIEHLTNHLYSVEVFTYKELTILYILMDKISAKEIIDILRILKKNSRGLYYSKEYRRALTLVLCEAAEVLSAFGCKKEAKRIIDVLDKYEIASSMFTRIIFFGTKGVWKYYFENLKEGRMMISEAIHIHEIAGDPNVTNFYKKKYEKYF